MTESRPGRLMTADTCVARAFGVAEREGVKVLSLDVFDTLLWRTVREPSDAFVVVGHALAAAGHLRVDPDAFALLRTAAERRARATSVRLHATPEVTIEEVYSELPANVVHGATVSELAAIELEVERSITFPDVAVKELARSLQESRGVQVVLVSDTYFSGTQLRRLVNAHSAGIRIDGVFTSSENRCNKGSGLYDKALASLGVRGRDVLHLGDNPDSDGAAAARSAIHTVLFDRRPQPLPTLVEREGVSSRDPSCRTRVSLPDGRDFGLTALRAKTLRRMDTTGFPGDDAAWWRTGAVVFGPVFTGFCEWVLDRSADEGVDRVFCVMREGSLLAPVLNRAARQRGVKEPATPIWLSRYVCSKAAIVNGSRDEIEPFLRRRKTPTVALASADLGVRPDRLRGLAGREGARLDDKVILRRFLSAVTEDESVRGDVIAHCSEARRRLAEYVVSTVGRRERRTVLVDLGWGATIQASLDAALRAEGISLETLGLYLLTNDAAVGRVLDGVAAEGFLGTMGLPDPVIRWIMRSPEILEQVCMPEVGSLIGFDEAGEAVTTPATGGSREATQRQLVREGIGAFQDEWGRYRDMLPAGQRLQDEGARPLLRSALLRFVVDPTVEEATIFGSWTHDENWGSDDVDDLFTGVDPSHLEYMTPLQLLDLPMDRLYWPFGLAALHNPPAARAAAAVAFGDVPAEVFGGADQTRVTIYVDYGAGLLPRRQPAARANSKGLYYLREIVDAHPLHAVAVGFPPGPGLVRLDWMNLRFHLRGQAEPVVVDLRWPDDAECVRYHGGELVTGNLLLGRRRAPRISYAAPDQWSSGAYRVEIELGYAWLPTTPAPPPRRDRADLALGLIRRAYPRAKKLVRLGRAVGERLRSP